MKPFCVIMSQLFVHYTFIQFTHREKEKRSQTNLKTESSRLDEVGVERAEKMRYREYKREVDEKKTS